MGGQLAPWQRKMPARHPRSTPQLPAPILNKAHVKLARYACLALAMGAGCDLFTPQREQTDAGGLYDATTPPDGSRDAVTVDLGVEDASTCDSGPACAPACSGTCCKGRCLETLASGQDNAVAIAVDGRNVYWATDGKTTSNGLLANTGSIVRVPTQGGTPVTLATLQNHPVSLGLDAAHLYWLDQGDLPDNGTVMSMPLGGGTPVTLASGQPDPQAIAVDPSRVYWTSFGPPDGGSPNASGYVVAVPLGGGTPTTLATAGTLPAGIAVGNGYIYWASCSGVQRLLLDGGTPARIASPPPPPGGEGQCATSIAVDAEHVFWWLQWRNKTEALGQLLSNANTGGPSTQLGGSTGGCCVEGSGPRFAVAALPLPAAEGETASHVYWADAWVSGVGVDRAFVDGGETEVLAEQPGTTIAAIAVDATSVYWATTGSTIMRLSPR
jgi:hypothetical protein